MQNGCVYCYANYSSKSVETNAAQYDPSSPLLCGQVQEDDKITIRKVESLKETQLSILICEFIVITYFLRVYMAPFWL